MELFVTVILLTVTGAQGRQLEGPQNTVSVVGSNVAFKCLSLSRNCTGIEWHKQTAGTPMTVFNHRGKISNAHVDRYSVENKSGCHLVIKNVELTDAGRYLCRALILPNTVEKSAYLIVLETHPKCTTNASINGTVEEDGVQLNCVMTYSGTNSVSMVWKGGEDSSTAVKNETGKGISPSYFVVASAPDVPSFTCITSFPVETKDKDGRVIEGLAANTPNATCETPIVKVLYSVRNVTLSPSLSYYTTGNVINCTAKGHPSPTFKWQEMENSSTWMDIQNQNGSEFSLSNVTSKRYRCVAMNFVRGKSYNATSHEFLVQSNSYNATSHESLVQSKSYNATSQEFLVQSKSNNATSSEFLDYNTGSDNKDRFTATTMYPLPLNSTTLPSDSTTLPSILMEYKWVVVGVAVGFLFLIVLLIICCCVRVCSGYKCCHSGKKSKDNIREEQPLTENPDTCIYSVVNKKQGAHPKAKPSLASTSVSPKRPQGTTTQAMPWTDNSKGGHTNAYQHEEVTYAELAMEVGPRKVVPKCNPEPQETLYASVGAA